MKKLFILLMVCLVSVLVSCVTTQQNVNTEKPNIKFEKIDEYNIEISSISQIRNVYFYRAPTGYVWSGDIKFQDFINETISNISFDVNGNEFSLKFSDYDDGLFIFYLADANGKKVSLLSQTSIPEKIILKSKRALSYSDGLAGTELKFTEDKISIPEKGILKSKRALSYSDGLAGTGLKFNKDKVYGREKYPYDCLICLNQLKISKNTKEEQEKVDLARAIIVKKYNFENSAGYINWLNRTNWNNLYMSLSAGSYSNTISFQKNDMIYIEEHLLTIEDMSYSNSGYLYLATAGKNQISKCCMIVSEHQLNYMNYYGAMVTEPLLLKFIGRNQYQQGYRSQNCDVFIVIERNSKEYNDYITMINDMAEIERNPYAYKNVLEN